MIQHDTKSVKRAAIYLRVSTDEQTKGYGLPVQKGKLEAFVNSQDYKLDEKHIYTEEGFSGTLPIASRPELKRLFDDAKNKEFDVVLVYRLDRFFRKTRLLLEAIDILSSYGVGFRSTTEAFDTTNSTGKFMTTMLRCCCRNGKGYDTGKNNEWETIGCQVREVGNGSTSIWI